jgi:hemoglobin
MILCILVKFCDGLTEEEMSLHSRFAKLAGSFGIVVALTSCQATEREPSPPAENSLYQRLGAIGEERLNGEPLGGAYKIAGIVSDVIDRMQVNEVIEANPSIMRISEPAMPGHKFEFTLLLCSMAGGPQQYAGRSLEEAHRGLAITQREWQAMLTELRYVLNEHDVPPQEQREFIAMIESTADQIIR